MAQNHESDPGAGTSHAGSSADAGPVPILAEDREDTSLLLSPTPTLQSQADPPPNPDSPEPPTQRASAEEGDLGEDSMSEAMRELMLEAVAAGDAIAAAEQLRSTGSDSPGSRAQDAGGSARLGEVEPSPQSPAADAAAGGDEEQTLLGEIVVGQRVECRFRESNVWYKADVSRVAPGGQYFDVQYVDGDREEDVARRKLRLPGQCMEPALQVGDQVDARCEAAGNKVVPGRIVAVDSLDGDTSNHLYSIVFDSGGAASVAEGHVELVQRRYIFSQFKSTPGEEDRVVGQPTVETKLAADDGSSRDRDEQSEQAPSSPLSNRQGGV